MPYTFKRIHVIISYKVKEQPYNTHTRKEEKEMTKTQIALTLAIQYATLESEMFVITEENAKYRSLRGTEEYDADFHTLIRSELKKARAKMGTVRESATLLNITDSQWTKALYEAYKQTNKSNY